LTQRETSAVEPAPEVVLLPHHRVFAPAADEAIHIGANSEVRGVDVVMRPTANPVVSRELRKQVRRRGSAVECNDPGDCACALNRVVDVSPQPVRVDDTVGIGVRDPGGRIVGVAVVERRADGRRSRSAGAPPDL